MFICGLHRSGTTQLHSTLATCPDIAGLLDSGAKHDEGQHLQSVYPTARQFGGPGKFAFDPRSHLTEHSELVSAESASRLFADWAPYWDLDRTVLLEKSPPNLVRMRFLQAVFPDARFIVIVRHPTVTALATRKLATTKWMRRTRRKASLTRTARHWFVAHRTMLEDLPFVRQRYLLRWEDFCADPDGRLADIAEFLGVEPRFTRPDLDASVNDKYDALWAQLRSNPDLRTRRLLAVLRANEAVARRFGYDVMDLRVRDELLA